MEHVVRTDELRRVRDGDVMRNDRSAHGFPYALHKTSFAWNSVPAIRVAMASSLACPTKTLTWRALENSGRLIVRPARMCAAATSSAVTLGKCGRSLRGWMKYCDRFPDMPAGFPDAGARAALNSSSVCA